MEQAVNSKNEIIDAISAEYDVYFCPECGELAYLRKPIENTPHFYHYEYNGACSLCCIKDSSTPFNINSLKLLQTNYKERWCEVMDNIIATNSFHLLKTKIWAITPIDYYINRNFDSISSETISKLVLVLLSVDHADVFGLINNYIQKKLLTSIDRGYIRRKLKSIAISSKNIRLIINNGFEDTFALLFFQLMKNYEKEQLLQNKNYKVIADVNYIFSDYISEQTRFDRYKYILEKYKQNNNLCDFYEVFETLQQYFISTGCLNFTDFIENIHKGIHLFRMVHRKNTER